MFEDEDDNIDLLLKALDEDERGEGRVKRKTTPCEEEEGGGPDRKKQKQDEVTDIKSV